MPRLLTQCLRAEPRGQALLAADHQTLATILADDFVIVDVMSGQAAHRKDLLDAISSGELQFADVRQYTEERSVRHRNSLAVVIERTQMLIRYQGHEITAKSRYTMSTRMKTADGASCRLKEHQSQDKQLPDNPAATP